MSETYKWPGGVAQVTVQGDFLASGGVYSVGTVLQLYAKEQQTDGNLKPPVLVKEFREPGQYAIAVPPGECFWSASGPEGMAWSVSGRLDEPPNRAKPRSWLWRATCAMTR